MKPAYSINLKEIKNIAIKNETRNKLLFNALLNLDNETIDFLFHSNSSLIEKEIDCKLCGNCCSEIPTSFSETESIYLSKQFGLSKEIFLKTKTIPQADEFIFNTLPCPFLIDKKCTIYENRPLTCQQYPNLKHTTMKNFLIGAFNNYHECPIVFFVIENIFQEYFQGKIEKIEKIEIL